LLNLIGLVYLKLTQGVFSCAVGNFLISALVEDLNPLRKQIWKNKFIKYLLCPWLLVVVILSNCYTGIVISAVNSPLQKERLASLKDIQCTCNITEENGKWKIYNATDIANFWGRKRPVKSYLGNKKVALYSMSRKQNDDRLEAALKKDNFVQKLLGPVLHDKCFSLFSALTDWAQVGIGLSALFPIATDFMLYLHASYNPDKPYVGNLGCPVYPYHPKKTTDIEKGFPEQTKISADEVRLDTTLQIDQELAKCGKSVYFGFGEDLIAEKEYLEKMHPRKQFYYFTLNDDMGYRNQRYFFQGEQTTKFLQIMSTLFESGLYRWRQSLASFGMHALRIRNKRTQEGFKDIQPIPGGLSGSLQTIFYIWSIGAAISMTVFAFEVLRRIKYKQIVTWVLNFPLLLRRVTFTVAFKFYELKMKLRKFKAINVQMRFKAKKQKRTSKRKS